MPGSGTLTATFAIRIEVRFGRLSFGGSIRHPTELQEDA
jgi:hypothetical protein